MSWPEVQSQRTKWMGLYPILWGFKNCETQKITLNFTVSGKFPLNPMDLEQSSEPWNIDNSLNLIMGTRAWTGGPLKGTQGSWRAQSVGVNRKKSFCGPPLKPGTLHMLKLLFVWGARIFGSIHIFRDTFFMGLTWSYLRVLTSQTWFERTKLQVSHLFCALSNITTRHIYEYAWATS
jgi:hypothetical protein